MTDNEHVHCLDLPKLTDDGMNNNYGKWRAKAYHKLRQLKLLKYVEGPLSNPPIIPPLSEPTTHHGLDDNGAISSVHVPGNVDAHRQALADAEPWFDGNDTALASIVAATPIQQIHQVQNETLAKQAWDNLRTAYQPCNSLRATTIRQQIMTYCCTLDMNITTWLNDMQRLYNSLCALDLERMTDREYTFAILDLMPLDDGWQDFLSGLRKQANEADGQGCPVTSTGLTSDIWEEYWFRHEDDLQATSHIFTTRFDAQKKSNNTLKRPRSLDTVAGSATTPSNTPIKCARGANPNKAHLKCNNPNCGPKTGHDTADCVAYKGAKEGQYGDWWRGPWNIHLPESQRTKENNVPPKTHPAYSCYNKVSVNQTQIVDNALERSNTTSIQSCNAPSHVSTTLTSNNQCYSWSTQAKDTIAQTSLPVLNPELPLDNSCYHDSRANRHVFHDRDNFQNYETIPPLTVKGFGKNLSTIAVGRGNIRLEGRYGDKLSPILLKNVLHIPAVRTNLISRIQLDNAGVVSTLGNKTIVLSANGVPIVGGAITHNMYRLDLTIVPPQTASLASRLAPLDLAS